MGNDLGTVWSSLNDRQSVLFSLLVCAKVYAITTLGLDSYVRLTVCVCVCFAECICGVDG